MAQAARLHLRLQKELKLLLTDPPPGASFPLLSSSSSLTTIDAQIKGPEGTVYAEGIFNIKIQIPERYPFQPPSVTFATPIYHPNIDNGGRICLDILNLPPKGAWQPSLNISTVLTSIGLLLSEPNPDDGLMCEVSREFKYNRQAFDHKARSMTQKYAHPAASGNACDSPFQSHANPSTVQLEVETTNHESKHEANEPVVSRKKLFGSSRKLSLNSPGQTQERNVFGEVSEVPEDNLFLSEYGNQMEVEGTEKVLKDTLDQRNRSQEKLCGSRWKFSLESLSQSQKKSDNGMDNEVPNHCPSLKSQNLHVSSSDSLVLQSGNLNKQGLHQSQDSKSTDDTINMRAKRLCQFGNKQPLGSLNTSKMINESNDKMLATPELSSSQSHSNALSEPFPLAPALDSVKCKPHKEFIDGMGSGFIDTSRKKLCLARKRLSLGLRGSAEKQEKGNKENVVPQVSEYYDKGSKNDGANVSHMKCGTDGPAKLQEENENGNNMLPHSHSVSSYPSKSFPKQQQNLSWVEKQQSYQGYNCDLTGTVKQKEAEESEIPESEAVIVLDSEDSEEERSAPSRSKPLLARKRLGKWRIRA